MSAAPKHVRGGNPRAALVAGVLLTLSGCVVLHTTKDEPSIAVIRAAGHGNPIAEYRVGLAGYERARSVQQRARGLAWIQLAADQNLAMAQCFLGNLYLRGKEVPQDTALALKWLNQAAEHGAPAAQWALGDLYERGDAVTVDGAKAYFWFSILAKPVRSNIAIYNIEQLRTIARRHLVNLSVALTQEQRAAIERRVAAWEPEPSPPYNGYVPLDKPLY